MPRSSRSHSTLVPAASMIASTPHVELAAAPPRHDREAAALAPALERGPVAAEVHASSMPPVPKVILAVPGAHAALADQRRPAGRRRARRSAGRRAGRWPAPSKPLESTTVGSIARGMSSASRILSSQSLASAAPQPGDAGVGGVGDVDGALGEGPGDPRVDRAEAQVPRSLGVGLVEEVGDLGRRRVGRDPDAVGLEDEAVADGAEVLPADARADGPPVRGPTRSSTPAGWRCRPPSTGPPSPSAARARSSAAAAITAASNSTRPGSGDDGSTGRWCTMATVASGRTTAARTPLVPTSTTRRLMAASPGPNRPRMVPSAPEPGADGEDHEDGRPRHGVAALPWTAPASSSCTAAMATRPASRRGRRVGARRGRSTIQPPSRTPTSTSTTHGYNSGEDPLPSARVASAIGATSAAGSATARAHPAPIATRRAREPTRPSSPTGRTATAGRACRG